MIRTVLVAVALMLSNGAMAALFMDGSTRVKVVEKGTGHPIPEAIVIRTYWGEITAQPRSVYDVRKYFMTSELRTTAEGEAAFAAWGPTEISGYRFPTGAAKYLAYKFGYAPYAANEDYVAVEAGRLHGKTEIVIELQKADPVSNPHMITGHSVVVETIARSEECGWERIRSYLAEMSKLDIEFERRGIRRRTAAHILAVDQKVNGPSHCSDNSQWVRGEAK